MTDLCRECIGVTSALVLLVGMLVMFGLGWHPGIVALVPLGYASLVWWFMDG